METKHRIQFDENHVALVREPNHVLWELNWDDVLEIAAWKDDLWSYDEICMGFRISEGDSYFWCDEEDQGWVNLMRTCEQRFGFEDGWWSKVAIPAFERKWTVFWKRPSEAPLRD